METRCVNTTTYAHTNCGANGGYCNLDAPFQCGVSGFGATNRCWQSTLAAAQAICDNDANCNGITRDGGGYEPRAVLRQLSSLCVAPLAEHAFRAVRGRHHPRE